MNAISSRFTWALLFLTTTLFVTQRPVAQVEQVEETIKRKNELVADYILLGLFKQEKGELKEAKKNFTKAIELDPTSAEAYTHRGLLNFEQGNHPEARQDLNKSLELLPNPPKDLLVSILSASAPLELEGGDPDKAIARVSRLIELEPTLEIYLIRAKAYLQTGMLELAVDDLTEVSLLDEDNAEAYQLRGKAYFELGDFSKAIEDLTEALKSDPENIQLLLLRGDSYLELNQPGEAIKDFDTVLALDPNNEEALRRSGRILFATGKFEEALEIYSSILKANPDNTAALVDRSLCYEKLDQLSKALDDLNRAMELDPTLTEKHKTELAALYMQRGSQFLEDGKWEDALADFKLAMQADEDSRPNAEDAMATAYLKRALQLLEDDGPEVALADLNSCLLLRPEDQQALRLRGGIHVQLGKYQEAIDDYTTFLELKPGDEQALFARGRSWNALKQYENATGDFTSIITNPLTDNRDIAFIERARSQAALNLFTEAIDDFKEAIRIEEGHRKGLTPELAGFHRFRGEQRFTNNEFAAAIEDFQSVEKLDKTMLPLIKSSYSKSHLGLGMLAFQDKKPEVAIIQFTLALGIDSAIPSALVGRGRSQQQLGELEQAGEDFTAAIAMRPADSNVHADALLGRAEVAIDLDKPEAAIADLSTATKLVPQPAPELLARCYTTRAQVRLDKKDRTEEDLVMAIQDLEAAVMNDDSLADGHRGKIVRALIDLGEMKIALHVKSPDMVVINSAISQLLRVLEVDPDATELIRSPLTRAYHLRGKLFHTKGDFLSAINDYLEAIKTDPGIQVVVSPDLALAFLGQGKMSLQRGELDRAITELRTALDWDVTIREIVKGPLAVCLARKAYQELEKGRAKEAIALLEFAAREHPGFVENLALARILKTQPLVTLKEMVLEDFGTRLAAVHERPRFWIEADPVADNVRTELGKQFERARVFRDEGLLQKALTAMDLVLGQGQALPLHYYYHGIILFELNEPRERWQTDFEIGSFLEAIGHQEAEFISTALCDVQGDDRMQLQDQRKLGPSILKLRKQEQQRLLEQQLKAAQEETRRFESEIK